MARLKLLLAGTAIALVALHALATSAGAATAEIDPAGRIAAASNGKVSFEDSIQTRCNITLNGTLRSSTDLEEGAGIGSVTELNIRNCENGSVSGVLSLPWELDLHQILEGESRELTGLLLEINDFSINFLLPFIVNHCLHEGSPGILLTLEGNGPGTYETGPLVVLEDTYLDFVRGSGLCPEERLLAGEFELTPQTIVVR